MGTVVAIAFDVVTALGTGTGNRSFSHAAAASNVKGALLVASGTGLTPSPTAITYGGVAMTQTPSSPAIIDSSIEDGWTSAWFLGSGLSQGTQTVDITANATIYAVTICTVTAAADTAVEDDAFNGQTTGSGATQLDFVTAVETFIAGVIWSATNAPSGIPVGNGTSDAAIDFGNDSARFSHLAAIQAAGTPELDWNGSLVGTKVCIGAAIKELSTAPSRLRWRIS